ncbi:PREDICTED: uncharacterized protein LOC105147952 [Acromyrmex echinatior]|uniref:uncharacterized protein LOC105147952 n=1 Tax=Acromyrmex echinatior TaxID=103372 RepID=UPI000580B68B|nr:PREDICTED: uncharacterized protein LOC105147952 [Acromyrmex echinatior]
MSQSNVSNSSGSNPFTFVLSQSFPSSVSNRREKRRRCSRARACVRACVRACIAIYLYRARILRSFFFLSTHFLIRQKYPLFAGQRYHRSHESTCGGLIEKIASIHATGGLLGTARAARAGPAESRSSGGGGSRPLHRSEERRRSKKESDVEKGLIKGPNSVPTRSSRRQQVLAFGTLGKGRNFGPGRTRDGHRFLGITPRFFTRWQHLDGALRCRELRLVSLEMCSESY